MTRLHRIALALWRRQWRPPAPLPYTEAGGVASLPEATYEPLFLQFTTPEERDVWLYGSWVGGEAAGPI